VESFGKWIKTRRVNKRLGLWRCAGYAGIGGEALRLIEAGKTNPAQCKTSTLYGLAVVLEIEPQEVIERAIHQDEELMRRLALGEKWKAEEREYSWECYERYKAKRDARGKSNSLIKPDF
jgi:hypothetical protein